MSMVVEHVLQMASNSMPLLSQVQSCPVAVCVQGVLSQWNDGGDKSLIVKPEKSEISTIILGGKLQLKYISLCKGTWFTP